MLPVNSITVVEDTSNLPSNSFGPTRSWVERKVSRPLGFSKFYNLPLFILFAGAFLGFSLARLPFLNIEGGKTSYSGSTAPGEWYHMHTGRYRIGITLHLSTCLPLGILSIWQFLPIIRHKFLLFHRLNGYIILFLALASNIGALMIADKAFGGGIDAQAGVGLLVMLTTISLVLAYYNIRKAQIEQHRAWMLRAFFYFGSIITTRIIQILSAKIMSITGGFKQVQSCAQIAFVYDSLEKAAEYYPICADGLDHDVVVDALFSNRKDQVGAAIAVPFGMAIWLALFVHLVGVEIYLNLTTAETDRLRRISYERQLERGYANPGRAGLTPDRIGDVTLWTAVEKCEPSSGR